MFPPLAIEGSQWVIKLAGMKGWLRCPKACHKTAMDQGLVLEEMWGLCPERAFLTQPPPRVATQFWKPFQSLKCETGPSILLCTESTVLSTRQSSARAITPFPEELGKCFLQVWILPLRMLGPVWAQLLDALVFPHSGTLRVRAHVCGAPAGTQGSQGHPDPLCGTTILLALCLVPSRQLFLRKGGWGPGGGGG